MSGFNDLQHLIASDADVARIAQHFFVEGGQELSQLDRMRANFAIRFYVNHLYNCTVSTSCEFFRRRSG
jgi:hypothetical protein